MECFQGREIFFRCCHELSARSILIRNENKVVCVTETGFQISGLHHARSLLATNGDFAFIAQSFCKPAAVIWRALCIGKRVHFLRVLQYN